MPPEYDAATLREYCGTVALEPTADVAAGSWGTWTFTFTVGTYGMDDRSNLRLVMRGVCDWGAPNFTDPSAPNYCRIHTDGNAKLRVHFDRENHVRPWRRTIHVHVNDGTLKAGEHIWIVLGDRSGGSPGSQAQTFVESTFEFKFFADNFGTLQFRELPDAPVVRIVAGPAAHLVAQAPSFGLLWLRSLPCWYAPTTPGVTRLPAFAVRLVSICPARPSRWCPIPLASTMAGLFALPA